jgi:hypothetical protein
MAEFVGTLVLVLVGCGSCTGKYIFFILCAVFCKSFLKNQLLWELGGKMLGIVLKMVENFQMIRTNLLLQAFHSQENQYYADYDKKYYNFYLFYLLS